MNIIIRGISEETVQKMDEAAKKKGLSRNQIAVKILDDFAAANDKFISNCLPAIVRSLVKEELERLTIGADSVENNVYTAAMKLISVAEKLENILGSLEKEYETDELLSLFEQKKR